MKIKSPFTRGIHAGLPIALGYIPIAITYGLIAKSQGLPLWFTVALSLVVFAGSSQFIALQLLAAGAGVFELVITTFAINFRNFLLASSVSMRGPMTYTEAQKALVGVTVTDESFALVSAQPEEKLPFGFIMGLQGVLYAAWNGGSLLGATLVGELGTLWNNSLGIAIYAMFISLLIPVLKSSRIMLSVSMVTGVLSAGMNGLGLHKVMGSSSVLLISAVAGAALGAYLLNREASPYE